MNTKEGGGMRYLHSEHDHSRGCMYCGTGPETVVPRTKAGRRAEYELHHLDTCAGMRGQSDCDCGVRRAILAIENEARRTVDPKRLAVALWTTHTTLYPQGWPTDDPHELDPSKDARARAAAYDR